jgi:hypothetical protein
MDQAFFGHGESWGKCTIVHSISSVDGRWHFHSKKTRPDFQFISIFTQRENDKKLKALGISSGIAT